MPENVFSKFSDDVVIYILRKLEDDPRHWARSACVSTKFSSLIRNICCQTKCSQSIPTVVSDLLSSAGSSTEPPGGWVSLYKLAVCCPGLIHSGVLLENSDFGLELELRPDGNHEVDKPASSSNADRDLANTVSDCNWSLYDDLCFDTLHNDSESMSKEGVIMPEAHSKIGEIEKLNSDFPVSKRRKICRSLRSHLASGIWNLSREQGNKLLAPRFKDDCLYICDWPGCIHVEEKRNYMLFRGVFKNFKQSRVWRTINEGNKSKINVNCAYCALKETWDLHSSFCLRRYFGYHDDGEPVVRAYVCENGHVSGAWTDWPLYT